jgi:hypothetical protein
LLLLHPPTRRNIVTGQSDVLAKTLAEHQHVDAMWYFGGEEGRYGSAGAKRARRRRLAAAATRRRR